MDGPNVNWALFHQLQEDITKEYNKELIDIGSCSLHTLHNCFHHGAQVTGWDIGSVLSALHILFKDVPARRDDYIPVTNSDIFPLSFCHHRWVENIAVARRAMEIRSNVETFINSARDKIIKEPQTKSYHTIKEWVQDPLAPAKLAFFIYVATPVEQFLLSYQSDAPMLPYLSGDISKMLHALLDIVVKSNILMPASSDAHKLNKIDVTDANNLKSCKDFELGFVTTSELAKSSCSDRGRYQFRQECKDFVVTLISHFSKKSPLNYGLVRNLTCLDPGEIIQNKDSCIRRFRRVLTALADLKRLNLNECDVILISYKELAHEAQTREDFRNFKIGKDGCHLDMLYHDALSKETTHSRLWMCIKRLLLLSHGQASVERSFSINKNVSTNNLSPETLVSRRTILDYIHHVGGIQNVQINNQIINAVQNAHSCNKAHLEKQRQEAASRLLTQKRKLDQDHITDLCKEIKELEGDEKSLTEEADRLSTQAEKERKIDLVVKSNSMREKAKLKWTEMYALKKEVEAMQKNLSSSWSEKVPIYICLPLVIHLLLNLCSGELK